MCLHPLTRSQRALATKTANGTTQNTFLRMLSSWPSKALQPYRSYRRLHPRLTQEATSVRGCCGRLQATSHDPFTHQCNGHLFRNWGQSNSGVELLDNVEMRSACHNAHHSYYCSHVSILHHSLVNNVSHAEQTRGCNLPALFGTCQEPAPAYWTIVGAHLALSAMTLSVTVGG